MLISRITHNIPEQVIKKFSSNAPYHVPSSSFSTALNTLDRLDCWTTMLPYHNTYTETSNPSKTQLQIDPDPNNRSHESPTHKFQLLSKMARRNVLKPPVLMVHRQPRPRGTCCVLLLDSSIVSKGIENRWIG